MKRETITISGAAEVIIIIIAKHACYRYFGIDKNNEINSRDRNEESFKFGGAQTTFNAVFN